MLKNCPIPSRIAMLTYADFREPVRREDELRKLMDQLLTEATEDYGQGGEESTATRFMFDEAHGQKRWRHLPPTIDLGYSEARAALLNYGSVIFNEEGLLSKETLQKCEVFIMPIPYGILVNPTEYEALVHWVGQGGCLLMCGFYFMEAHLYTNFSFLGNRLQIDFGRNLIMPQGRTTRDDALKQAFPVRRDLCAFFKPQSEAPQHPIMSGVRRIALQSACSVHSRAQKDSCDLDLQTDRNVSIMSPLRGEYSDLIEGKFDIVYEYDVVDSVPSTFLVAQSFEKGRIVATGSWRMFVNDYMKDSSVDNLRLFCNLALWLKGCPVGHSTR